MRSSRIGIARSSFAPCSRCQAAFRRVKSCEPRSPTRASTSRSARASPARSGSSTRNEGTTHHSPPVVGPPPPPVVGPPRGGRSEGVVVSSGLPPGISRLGGGTYFPRIVRWKRASPLARTTAANGRVGVALVESTTRSSSARSASRTGSPPGQVHLEEGRDAVAEAHVREADAREPDVALVRRGSPAAPCRPPCGSPARGATSRQNAAKSSRLTRVISSRTTVVSPMAR